MRSNLELAKEVCDLLGLEEPDPTIGVNAFFLGVLQHTAKRIRQLEKELEQLKGGNDE